MNFKSFVLIATLISGYAVAQEQPQVISVEPKMGYRPMQVCSNHMVQVPRSQGASTMGGLLGGIVGSQIGHGDTRVAGAVIGSIVGSGIANQQYENRYEQRTVCNTTYEQYQLGEVITFSYRGRTYTQFTPF